MTLFYRLLPPFHENVRPPLLAAHVVELHVCEPTSFVKRTRAAILLICIKLQAAWALAFGFREQLTPNTDPLKFGENVDLVNPLTFAGQETDDALVDFGDPDY